MEKSTSQDKSLKHKEVYVQVCTGAAHCMNAKTERICRIESIPQFGAAVTYKIQCDANAAPVSMSVFLHAPWFDAFTTSEQCS